MNGHAIHHHASSWKTAQPQLELLIASIGIGMALAGSPVYASDAQTSWECSNYTGDAHTRCLEAFAESQRDQITALQEKMHAQQDTITQLTDQLDRQTSRSADLERRLAQPPAVVQAVPPPYLYPPIGLGLYYGHSWAYGPPFFYRPYGYRW